MLFTQEPPLKQGLLAAKHSFMSEINKNLHVYKYRYQLFIDVNLQVFWREPEDYMNTVEFLCFVYIMILDGR
jgi:hypothetical protein